MKEPSFHGGFLRGVQIGAIHLPLNAERRSMNLVQR
jgi:hypothetical protein